MISIKALLESSPDVRSEVVDACEPDVLERVRQRDVDVGLVYCSRTTDLERLFSRELEVAMVHSEPLASRPPAGDGTRSRPRCQHSARRGGSCQTRTCASLVTAVRLVVASDALTLAPASLTPFARSVGAMTAAITEPLPPVEAAVVWRRHERPSPVLTKFLRAALWASEPDRLGPGHRRDAGLDDT